MAKLLSCHIKIPNVVRRRKSAGACPVAVVKWLIRVQTSAHFKNNKTPSASISGASSECVPDELLTVDFLKESPLI